ncbi:MAG: HTH domain-containing protein [Lewinellaceae bacterium]|nr:HTH domain-containing protein [Lewinellaceae bacterium]MCB9291052.1 HTH domain-containing protein [Lewinellaceae bacterium]
MSLLEKIERVERIHRMIQYKRTGNPGQFARKLGVSRSMLYQMLKELKQLGAPIAYCKYRQSYLYLHPVRFRFGFEENTLTETEAVRVNGGVVFSPAQLIACQPSFQAEDN